MPLADIGLLAALTDRVEDDQDPMWDYLDADQRALGRAAHRILIDA